METDVSARYSSLKRVAMPIGRENIVIEIASPLHRLHFCLRWIQWDAWFFAKTLALPWISWVKMPLPGIMAMMWLHFSERATARRLPVRL